MNRKRRVKMINRLTISAMAIALLTSCSEDNEGSSEDAIGKMRLPLVIVVNEDQYRLDGTLVIEDDETPPNPVKTIVTTHESDGTELEVELAQGGYTITLQKGWSLYDKDGNQVEATVVSDKIAFRIRAYEETAVRFEFLIGDSNTKGTATISADAENAHVLTGEVKLAVSPPCSSQVAGPCGPLSDLDGKEVGFVLLFEIESDAFAGEIRQITTGPLLVEFFGDNYLETVVGPALTNSNYSFNLRADENGDVWFNSTAHLTGEGSDGTWDSVFDMVVTGASNGSAVEGITSLTAAELPAFSVTGGILTLSAESTSTGGITKVKEDAAGSGTFYYGHYFPEESQTVEPNEKEPAIDVIVSFDAGNFSNSGQRFISQGREVDGPFAADEIATKIIDGRIFGQFEGERTNHITRSQQLEHSDWQRIALQEVTIDAMTAPDGTNTAEKIVADSDLGAHGIGHAATVTSGQTYVMSSYVRADEFGYARLAFTGSVQWQGGAPVAVFNIRTGKLDDYNNGVARGIEPFKNGWYRIWLAATAASSGSSSFQISGSRTDSPLSQGDGIAGFYAWQVQVETGIFASSPIVTDDIGVTRAKDGFNWPAGSVPAALRGRFALQLIPEYDRGQEPDSEIDIWYFDDADTAFRAYLNNAGELRVSNEADTEYVLVTNLDWNRGDTLTIVFDPQEGQVTTSGFITGDMTAYQTPWQTDDGPVYWGESSDGFSHAFALISEPYQPPCDAGSPCPAGKTCVLSDMGHPVCTVTGVEVCDDRIDNDSDGLVDCADSSCMNDAACPEDCGDGVDNDFDTYIDCYDPDCISPRCPEICDDVIDESPIDNDYDGLANCDDPDCMSIAGACPEACGDEYDNDSDGSTDCEDDDCWFNGTDCPEICDDGNDNDGDELTDCDDLVDCMLAGTGCVAEICEGGIDEDGDGAIDCLDQDCKFPGSICNEDTLVTCNDDIDNDGDDLVDCDDPECTDGNFGCSEVCDDVYDNDRDGLVNCDDPDCWVENSGCKEENDETCDDINDNDGDGFVDCADEDCRSQSVCNDVLENVAALFSDGEFSNPSTRYIWYDDESGNGTIAGPFLADKLASKVIDGRVFGQFEGERTNYVLYSDGLDENAHWILSSGTEPTVTRLSDTPSGPTDQNEAFRISYPANEASIVEQTVSGLTEGTNVSFSAYHHKDEESSKTHWRFESSNNAIETLVPTPVEGRLIWERFYSISSGDDGSAWGIGVDRDENVIIVGSTSQPSNANSPDLFVAKYDSYGKQLWTDVYDGGDDDVGIDLAIEDDGDILIIANVRIDSEWRNIVRKYDPNGNVIWTVIISDKGVKPGTIAVGNTGDFYVSVGTTKSVITYKFDSSGAEIWRDQFGGDGYFHCVYDMSVDSNENIIVVATISSDNLRYSWTRKYDSSGNELWTVINDEGQVKSFSAGAVDIDSRDNVFVNGYFYSEQLTWLSKYDLNGNVIWTQVDYDGGQCIGGVKIDDETNIIATGSIFGAEESFLLVKKYDSQGNEIWSETYPKLNWSEGHRVTVDNAGHIFVAGNANIFYDEVRNGWFADPWVAKLSDKYQSGWRRAEDRRVVETGTTDVIVGLRNSEDGAEGSILAWNVQLEEGLFPSSPITTRATTETRSADNFYWPSKRVGEGNRLRGRIAIDVIPEYASDEVPADGAYLMWFADPTEQIAFYITPDARIVAEEALNATETYVQTSPLVWNRGQKLTIVFDPPRGEISIDGFDQEEATFTGDSWSTDRGDVIMGRRALDAGSVSAAFALISEPYLIERCDDGGDNDEDGKIDCADRDCWRSDSGCAEVCDDEQDNDGDDNIDCQDMDCRIIGTICHPEVCDNGGVDEDGDGLVDCADPDCMVAGSGCPENSDTLCHDNLNNDGDEFTDCADPDCWQAGFNCPEICGDNVDNDVDGDIDCFDEDCGYEGSGCIEDNPQLCTDGIDNDGDAVIDCADSGCRGQTGCETVTAQDVVAFFSDGRYTNPSTRYIWYDDGATPGRFYGPFERNKIATAVIDGQVLGQFEGERTNLIRYNQEYDSLEWVKQSGASVVANNASLPQENPLERKADRLVFDTSSSSLSQNGIGLAANTEYAQSLFFNTDQSPLSWLSQISVESDVIGSISQIGIADQWQRISGSFTTSSIAQVGLLEILGTGPAFPGNALFWGSQLEAGAFASSPIVTGDTAANRQADEFWWPAEVIGQEHPLRGRFAVTISPEYASADVPNSGAYLFWFDDLQTPVAFVIRPASEGSDNAVVAVEEAYGAATTYVKTEPFYWNSNQKFNLIFDPLHGDIEVEMVLGSFVPYYGKSWKTDDGDVLMGKHLYKSSGAAFALISEPFQREFM
ncbi:MAG: hypothetical protein JXA30_21735 [Deltaproteobacteria bacterium]|nr:hypothetical protein [Deltaproteobacteria bacterium]